MNQRQIDNKLPDDFGEWVGATAGRSALDQPMIRSTFEFVVFDYIKNAVGYWTVTAGWATCQLANEMGWDVKDPKKIVPSAPFAIARMTDDQLFKHVTKMCGKSAINRSRMQEWIRNAINEHEGKQN